MRYKNLYGGNELPESFSAQDNLEYFKKIKNGDKEIINEIAVHNLGLVVRVARSYSRKCPTVDVDELASIGHFGLLKAVETFDLTKGFKFSTWACANIAWEISDELTKHTRERKRSIRSLDENTCQTDEEGIFLTCLEVLNDSTSKYNHFQEKIENEELYSAVDETLNSLTNIERRVIEMAYGFENEKPMTDTEIAGVIDRSIGGVSYIERNAREKIGKALVKRKFFPHDVNKLPKRGSRL